MRKLIFICCLLASSPVLSQSNKQPYTDEWRKADSLINRSLPESARKIVMAIYEDAKLEDRPVMVMKTQLYLLRLNSENADNADAAAIAMAEEEAAESKFPYNAIWKSIIAEMYWGYYQNNRWQILQRTNTADSTSADIAFWSADKFYDKTGKLYKHSLADAKGLQQIKVSDIDPLIYKGNTRKLRPTVFDLLAFRAVAYFENEEKEITNAAKSFSISDPEYFASATRFAKLELATTDVGSLQFNALQLYQQIIKFHLEDAKPDALIDADMQRLQFVYTILSPP